MCIQRDFLLGFVSLSHPTRYDDRVVSYFDAVFHCRSNQSNQQKRSYSERTWIRRTWLSVSDRRLPAPVSPLDSILCRELQTIDPLLLLLLLLLYTRRFPSILFSFREKLKNKKKNSTKENQQQPKEKRNNIGKRYIIEMGTISTHWQHCCDAVLCLKSTHTYWVWWSVVDLPVNLECLEFHFQAGGRTGVADSWWEMLVGTSLATCHTMNERFFLPNTICSWRRLILLLWLIADCYSLLARLLVLHFPPIRSSPFTSFLLFNFSSLDSRLIDMIRMSDVRSFFFETFATPPFSHI